MIRFLFALLCAAVAHAATLPTDGSLSDTQSKINSAANGDTVLLPLSGSFTWASTGSIPSTKWITLDLNGSTVTATARFTVNPHASGTTRLTNGTWRRGDGNDSSNGYLNLSDARAVGAIRVDHITFNWAAGGDVTLVSWNGQGSGLMDHCTFTGMTFGQEFVHIDGWGSTLKTGWTVDSGDTLAGSATILYFEDCTFTQASSQGGVSWIQGYYGCRIGIRHNVFDHISVDMHGTTGNIGARWWEFYNNTHQNTVGGLGSSPIMNIRAGSGVCHDNSASGSGWALAIQLCEEDSGYPALWQVGRGLSTVGGNPTAGSDLALDPARVWNNTNVTCSPDACDAPEVPGMVQLNRDVYESARPGYTAYTYPHPLQGAGGGVFTSGMSGAATIRGGATLK